MRTRRFLAAMVLAALPLVAGALHATPSRHADERPDGPRWLHSLGLDWDYAIALSERLVGCWGCPMAVGLAR